jgi:hypothetical protein
VEHTSYSTRDRPLARSPRRPPPVHSSPVRLPLSARLIDRIRSPGASQQPPNETAIAADLEADETSRSEVQPPQRQEIPNTPMSPSVKPSSTQSGASPSHKKKELEKKERAGMYENTSDEYEEDGWDDKTDTSIGISDGENEVPGKPIKHVGEPAPYRMARNGINRLTVKGHMCVEKPTYWDTKASILYDKWRTTSSIWVWFNGFLMHMAREASKVPFDQRSHAQRWTVLNATRAGPLPLNNARAEPDVERIAAANAFPETVRKDDNGRYNVMDITAWLLIKMSEPKEAMIIDWFWWEVCQIFSEQGVFSDMMKEMGLREVNDYMPMRFLINGEPKTRDVVKHFVYNGVRVSDVNLHLREFAAAYLKANSLPMMPEWAIILRSRPYMPRLSVTKCQKYGPMAELASMSTYATPNAGESSRNERNPSSR